VKNQAVRYGLFLIAFCRRKAPAISRAMSRPVCLLYDRNPLTLGPSRRGELIFTHIFGWTQGASEPDEQGFSTWR